MSRRILVTGGAGFVGASVALGVARSRPAWSVTALDNLRRRGSELNLPRLRDGGIGFAHGDVRVLDDVLGAGRFDAIVECSAEPSVLAGGDYVLQANLVGAYHCLELARRCGAQLVFLSSSRVYPIAALERLAYVESDTRFELLDEQELAGVSAAGVSERFPLDGARTLYGATKLAAELLIEEYHASFGLRTVIDRCGVIAGPWQMGNAEQGVFAHWMLAHHLGRPLRYLGYGGAGKQVRDLLHVEDLVELIALQLDEPERWSGVTANVGGGRGCSLSLAEATALCRQISGRHVTIEAEPVARPGDVPIYLSDCARLFALTDWRPQRDPNAILADTHAWITEHEDAIRAAL
jgi:CDP-paratose 2-epimerase